MTRAGSHGPATIAMVAAATLWGATFVMIRDSLRAVDPAALVATRFAAAAVLLGAVAVLRRTPFDRRAARAGILGGLCAAAGFLFQAIGLLETRVGSSAFLTCIGTLFAGVFAWPILGERPGRVLTIGLAVAGTGAALLSADAGIRLGTGERWTLLGALCFGLQVVAVARDAPRADPIAITLIQSVVIAVVLAPWVPSGAWAGIVSLDGPAVARLAYLAVAGSAVAPFLMVFAQRRLPAGRVGLLLALEPVFALLFAIALAGERYPLAWWAGAALILAAVGFVEAAAEPAPPATPEAAVTRRDPAAR